MNIDELLASYGLHLGTFIVCVISGFVPVVNAEVYLVAVSSFTSGHDVWIVVLLAALGQMVAKVVMFLGAQGLTKWPARKYEARLELVRKKFEQRKTATPVFIFISAFTGFPPFYLVSMMGGILNLNLASFCVMGFLGRFLRFGVVAFFPQVLKYLL